MNLKGPSIEKRGREHAGLEGRGNKKGKRVLAYISGNVGIEARKDDGVVFKMNVLGDTRVRARLLRQWLIGVDCRLRLWSRVFQPISEESDKTLADCPDDANFKLEIRLGCHPTHPLQHLHQHVPDILLAIQDDVGQSPKR